MVKTLADVIYHEMDIRGILSEFDAEKTKGENIQNLSRHIADMNVTKCSLSDLDSNDPGTLLYLQYLIQNNCGANFGICQYHKVWKNQTGWQYGCFFDKGKGERIQVGCNGIQDRCERQEELALANSK